MSRGINADELISRKKAIRKDINEFLSNCVERINKELEEIQKISDICCESDDTYLKLAELKVDDRNVVTFVL